ncbi:MAG: Rpn family recombination-promoting nuclease/putative transposase [Polyangiaceae bacterium]
MARPIFADPKTDFAFKRIFGSEEHKDVLVAFLNDMLSLDAPHRIVSVELLPPEQRPAVAELKLSIVDVKCTDARGVTYVVEMQVLQVEGFEKRVVYNVAKAYVNQNVEDCIHSATDSAEPGSAPPPLSGLRPPNGGHQIARGELYPDLNDVVGITICDFVLWPHNDERAIPMLSRWEMTERGTGARDLGQIRLVFLELPKYDSGRPPQTVVEKWAYFFRETENLTVVPEELSEHPFVDALEAARTAGFTAAEWDAYILAGIALQNERGALSIAEKRGEMRGEMRGREQALRFAIEGLCNVLAIELTEERKRRLDSLDAEGLTGLFAHLQQRRAWP